MTIGNQIIRASAGTGKTYQLSSRYLRLLLDGVDPNSILATTFTCKAAGEILDRVVGRLASAALEREQAVELAVDLGHPNISQRDFGELLLSMIGNLNTIRVQTIDAFFSQIARSFSLELGLPPDWEIVEETTMGRLRDRAIRRVLTSSNAIQLVHLLNKGEAARSVTFLMRETVAALYAIFLEAPAEAWTELQEQPVLSETEIQGFIGQLEQATLQDSQLATLLEKTLVQLHNEDWDEFIRVGLGKKAADGSSSFNRKTIPSEVLAPLRALAVDVVTRLLNYLVYQTQGAFQFLSQFDAEFDRLKLDYGWLRFEDVNYLAKVLVDHFRPVGLAYRLDQQIDHVLVDEFQDTSIAQWQVIEPLARRAISHPDRCSFFCVGDIKQAIYGWRGGVSQLFDDVQTGFQGAIDNLEQNKSYRSSPVIIDMVNETFGNLLNHRKLEDYQTAVQRWVENFHEHETHKTNLSGHATIEKAPSSQQHTAYSVARIKELYQATDRESIAVLTRTNDEVARLIFALGQAGVPASEEGGNPLTDSAAVNLALSALRLIDHPTDRIARFHVAHSPLAGLFDLTSETWDLQPGQACYRSQVWRTRLMDTGYGGLLTQWSQILNDHCTTREWFRLCQLVELGYRIDRSQIHRPAEFIQWVENTPVNDPSTSRVRVMTIHKSKGLEFDIVVAPHLDFNLTGRPASYIIGRDSPTAPIEFVCRYVERMKRQWLPPKFQSAFDDYTQHEVHEALALTYVAMTRAKRALHIIIDPKIHGEHKKAVAMVLAALRIDNKRKKKRGDDSDGQAVLWERGDAQWFRSVPNDPHFKPAAALSVPGQKVSRKAADEKPGDRTGSSRSVWKPRFSRHRFSAWRVPSAQKKSNEVRVGQLLSWEERAPQRLRGSLIHACLQQVLWLDDGISKDTELIRRLSALEGATAEAISDAITEFRKMIKGAKLSRLLTRQQYDLGLLESFDRLEVRNEQRFITRVDDEIISGSMDRLVLLYRGGKVVGADVIDYKTDQLDPLDRSGIEQRAALYREQLTSYHQAVCRNYGLPASSVTASLVFVAIDHVLTVA